MARVVVPEEGLFKWHSVRVSKLLLTDICAEVRVRIGNTIIKKITSPFIKKIIKETCGDNFIFIAPEKGVVLRPLVISIDNSGKVDVAVCFPFYAEASEQRLVIESVIQKEKIRGVCFTEMGCGMKMEVTLPEGRRPVQIYGSTSSLPDDNRAFFVSHSEINQKER